jgi:hypothetical protein
MKMPDMQTSQRCRTSKGKSLARPLDAMKRKPKTRSLKKQNKTKTDIQRKFVPEKGVRKR